jgi:hypothetical protein
MLKMGNQAKEKWTATHLRVNKDTVHKWIRNQTIPAYLVGVGKTSLVYHLAWMFADRDLECYIL